MNRKPLDILDMERDDLLQLRPENITWLLSPEEILHIFEVMGGLWLYNYTAAETGKVGLHALLKSKRCSDGFFNSKVVLNHHNLRRIFAQQLVRLFDDPWAPKPDFVCGIPDGATELGKDVAAIMGVAIAKMRKVEGIIQLIEPFPSGNLLLVEDFCTRGTGFRQAVTDIIAVQKGSGTIHLLPLELVILNRGGLNEIRVDDVGDFTVQALVKHRIQDWERSECPLCKMGSKLIPPKKPEKNWDRLTASQL